VLALYPGTTCLYEAEVLQPPSRRRKENDYLVRFADDEQSDTPHKAVGQAFVLNMPTPGGGSGTGGSGTGGSGTGGGGVGGSTVGAPAGPA
jgi:hypothetical protein